MPRRVLIVTNSEDLHADLVAERIGKRGPAPFRLDLDDYPAGYELGYVFSGGRWEGSLVRTATGDSISLRDVGAVWMRKRAAFRYRCDEMNAHERAHSDAETGHMLLGILRSLDCAWMSHPDAVRGSQWKPEQLRRAARLGFAVPESLMTNVRAEVDRFAATAEHGIVFKVLSSIMDAAHSLGPEEPLSSGVPTTLIGPEHEEMLDSVAQLPCFFQHYVPKRHELRVTVVGEAVHAARIHSQDDARTATDWRDMSAEIRYEAEALDPDVARRCLDFVHSYGLTFGAIDLVVTPTGEHVFLENNPVGQFLFVEQLVPELDLTGAVAGWLVDAAGAFREAE